MKTINLKINHINNFEFETIATEERNSFLDSLLKKILKLKGETN